MPKGSLLVLFEILLTSPNYRFFMNSPEFSVYSFEEEVLISDGIRCKIIDIKKMKEAPP